MHDGMGGIRLMFNLQFVKDCPCVRRPRVTSGKTSRERVRDFLKLQLF